MSERATWSRYRIAPLMDDSVFELKPDAPGTTSGGRPWVRWANVGDVAGWYAVGTRRMAPGEERDFWRNVYVLASEAGNGNVDAVHAIGPGILSVGGLSVTLASGWAQTLLLRCLQRAPVHWLESMITVLSRSGTRMGQHGDAGNGGMLCDTDGDPLDAEELERRVHSRHDGKTWTSSKRVARAWVESVSRMLSPACMDGVQIDVCRAVASETMPDAIRGRISWPTNGIQDAWMFSREQRALWAAVMVLLIEDERQTVRVVRDCVQTEPVDARASLGHIANAADDEAAFEERFRKRIRRTVRRVREVFGVTG